jgi:hypothetical protein
MTTIIEDKPKTQAELDEEVRANHRKKLEALSLKSLGEIPQLDEPTSEQQEWIKKKIWRSK